MHNSDVLLLCRTNATNVSPKDMFWGCLWLLDEPLSALDLRHQRQCIQRVQQLKAEGKAVLMVVHDLNLALRYADRVLMLSCGQLTADGTPGQVLTAKKVSDVFQVETRLEQGVLSWI